jgi:hypothetical protein
VSRRKISADEGRRAVTSILPVSPHQDIQQGISEIATTVEDGVDKNLVALDAIDEPVRIYYELPPAPQPGFEKLWKISAAVGQ